jgi:hypothetical protein
LSFHFDSDGDNTAQAARASACHLAYLHVINPNTANAFIQLFDAVVADVTVGVTTPRQSYFVPAEGAFDLPVGGMPGMWFDVALTYACTTTATGSGDPTTGLTVSMVFN